MDELKEMEFEQEKDDALADERKLLKLIGTRRGKLGALTRKSNDIKSLIDDDGNKEIVDSHVEAFNALLAEFMELQVSVQSILPEEEREADHSDWYEPKLIRFKEFLWDVDVWLRGDEAAIKQSLQDQVGPQDSVSQHSSSASSALRKAEAERAALRARADVLNQKLALDVEEAQVKAQIKARRERLELESELAAADAKIKILEECDMSSQAQTKEKKTELKNDVYEVSTPTEYMNPIGRSTVDLNAQTMEQAQQTASQRMDGANSSNANDQILVNIMGKQNDITEALVKQLQHSLLPTREIPVFNGDPLQYRSFIKAFEHGIEAKTDNDQDRLYYLEQYTGGQPRELVRSCFHMEPSRGYRQAKQQLEWNFGNVMKITTAYVNKALSWAPIKAEDGQALRAYALFLRGCCNTMQDVQHLEELENLANLRMIVSKLPFKLRDRWRSIVCDFQEKQNKRVRFEQLVEFVEKQARIALEPMFGDIIDLTTSKGGFKTKSADTKQKLKPTSRGSSFATTVTSLTEDSDVRNAKCQKHDSSTLTAFHKPCMYCTGDHTMELCQRMKHRPNKEKVEFLKARGLCFGCLTRGHMSKDCHKRMTCQVCQQKHPSVLHIEVEKKKSSQTEKESLNETTTKSSVSSALVSLEPCKPNGAGSKECTLAIVPVKVKLSRGSRTVQTYAFLDPGSSATFCTEALMTQLNAKGKRMEILLRTMGQEKPVFSYKITGLEVAGLNSNTFLDLPDVYTQQSIPVTNDNIPAENDIRKWPYLKDVELTQINAGIGLLIGVNTPKALEPWRIINSEGNGPYAVQTLLGWVVNGPLSNGTVMDEHGRPCMGANRISIASLEEMLVKQYNQDFAERHYEEKSEVSMEDKQFLNIVSTSATLEDGHYHLKLPFRKENVSMPNNRQVAEQRAAHLLKKFRRNDTFFEEYKRFMNDVITKGYAEMVPNEQLERDDGKIWYIPHHGVYHPRKKTIRVVFDCASAFRGTSLNHELLQGPNLTNTLIGVLLRFRQGPIALMADIEGMFHQVRVARDDVDFLRFFWWLNGDINQGLTEHRMTVHLFGAVSSPSCATFALLKTADDNRNDYPAEVINTVKNNFYVDDCLKSVDTEDQAMSLYRGLTEVCAKGGFKLTKWISNCRTLLSLIPEEERAKEVKTLDLDRECLPMERALGAQWNVDHDTFTFSMAVKKRPTTRRGILSVVHSVYDPLGFLAPVILTGKRILQDLCKIKLGWDEDIPEVIAHHWQRWMAELEQLNDFYVDRCFTPKDFGVIKAAQLHHFCDASEVGYGTVSYLRLTSCSNNVHSAFIMGKARVAPLKQTTIPRLELAAAVLAVRMDRMQKTELHIQLDESVFWSDSMTVLKYIANNTRRFQTFVANRVSTIRDMSKVAQWRHISSSLNPADDASRGLGAGALLQSKRWISGPDFLTQSESEWPSPVEDVGRVPDDDPEVRNNMAVYSTVVEGEKRPTSKLIEHFSKWNSLRRAVAWILKFKKMLQCLCQERKVAQKALCAQVDHNKTQNLLEDHMKQFKDKLTSQNLSVDDMAQAEEAIVCFVQEQSFYEEMSALKKGWTVKKSSRIYRLDPVMVNGVLRVGGRLSRSAMPEEVKHPAILPKGSHVSKLILTHIHELVGHGGRNHMLSRLRRHYWILQANSAARTIIKGCHVCRRQRGKVGEQKMSDLPTDRITPDLPPFTLVGMDYFGPIEVKRGRATVKRYGVIFTCLACRAIHLEVAHSLDTDSCINALRRFICRRGQVKEIRSDNGTNFIGSVRELKEALNKLNAYKIQKTLLQDGITWKFNPPHGAHHGGVWERLIQQVKNVLHSILRQQSLDDEALQTTFCEVEAILNDRPITSASDDPNDLEALTPNHLIQLKGKPILPPGLFSKEDMYLRRRWRQVQYIADLFWKRWTKEYLPMMQERQKWNRKRRNFAPGDVVLIMDSQAPRNSWLMGRIINTIPDSKGFVRRVLLKTKTNELERPIDKICLLQEAEA